MTKRSFIKAALAMLAGDLGLTKAKAEPGLRAVHRMEQCRCRPGCNLVRPVRVRMADLRPGDVFRLDEYDNAFEAISEPWALNGVWGIDAEVIPAKP